MLKRICSIYGAGWRASMVKPLVIRPGGTRGIKRLQSPLNPYSNPYRQRHTLTPFWAPVRWLAALVWDMGRIDGGMKQLSK